MRISFWYEYGKIDGIGTGHKYRSHALGRALREKGHTVSYIEDDVIINNSDILVIDHMCPPKSVIDRAISIGMKIVALDGKDPRADVSISAFQNDYADYKGLKYIAFPKLNHTIKYDVAKKNNTVFVGMGGYDKNNLAHLVLEVLDKMEVNAIVAKSINHTDFRTQFSRVEMFTKDNYYDAKFFCFHGFNPSIILQILSTPLPSI